MTEWRGSLMKRRERHLRLIEATNNPVVFMLRPADGIHHESDILYMHVT